MQISTTESVPTVMPGGRPLEALVAVRKWGQTLSSLKQKRTPAWADFVEDDIWGRQPQSRLAPFKEETSSSDNFSHVSQVLTLSLVSSGPSFTVHRADTGSLCPRADSLGLGFSLVLWD